MDGLGEVDGHSQKVISDIVHFHSFGLFIFTDDSPLWTWPITTKNEKFEFFHLHEFDFRK